MMTYINSIVSLLLVVISLIPLLHPLLVLFKCFGVLTRSLLSVNISLRSTGISVTQSTWRCLSHSMNVLIPNISLCVTSARKFCKWRKTCLKLSNWSARYANKNEITRMNHSHHVYSLVWMRLTRLLWMLPLLSRMTFCNKTVTAITIVTVPSTRLLGCFVTWLASTSMPLMWWKQATTKSLGPRFVIPWATSCTSFLLWSLKYVPFYDEKGLDD